LAADVNVGACYLAGPVLAAAFEIDGVAGVLKESARRQAVDGVRRDCGRFAESGDAVGPQPEQGFAAV